MPLLIGYDPAGLDSKVRRVLDDITAAVQVWAGRVDGINAEERLSQLATGISSLATVQPGTIEMYGGSSAPTGYLLCDGSAVSRSTYAALFAVLGTTYGAGNGSTTFNVPNLRQRFPLGKAASGTGATLGSTGGTIDHTHTGPSHSHSISSSGSHTHDVTGITSTFTLHFSSANVDNNGDGTTVEVVDGVGLSAGPSSVPAQIGHSHSADGNLAAATDGSHDHGGETGSDGTGATSSANPPFCVVNFIVKT